jgi:hypothetical protein
VLSESQGPLTVGEQEASVSNEHPRMRARRIEVFCEAFALHHAMSEVARALRDRMLYGDPTLVVRWDEPPVLRLVTSHPTRTSP